MYTGGKAMTIRHLKIFLAVAETGNMSQAAKQLYLAQPTVSQAIRELEEHYETQLFERLSKRLFITEAGKELLVYSRQVVHAFDKLEQDMISATHHETLRIGASITVGTCLLPLFLQDLQEENPRVITKNCVTNTRSIQELLLNSELDIAVVEGQITSPDLVVTPLIDDYLILCCSPSHPFASMAQIPIHRLQGEDFAMREKGSGTRALFEYFLAKHHITVNTRWEANCPTTIRRAVIYDHCLSVMSVRLLTDDIKAGVIHPIRTTTSELNRSFSLVHHKNKLITPAMESFITIVKKYRHPEDLSCLCNSVLLPE